MEAQTMASGKAQDGPVSADRLKSFVERIEKLMEERKAIGGDIADVFMEAKGVGYDVKTIRSLIKVRSMDAAERDEQEALLDTYMHALGMETAATLIVPTEEDLLDRASRIVHEVDRCMSLVTNGKLPKIADIQELVLCSAGKASKLRSFVADRISRTNEFTVKSENETPAHDPETGEMHEEEAPALPPKHAAAVGAVLDAIAAGDDDLALPPFLDRRHGAEA
jgi:uncharacterized protein (UPF0335 family)